MASALFIPPSYSSATHKANNNDQKRRRIEFVTAHKKQNSTISSIVSAQHSQNFSNTTSKENTLKSFNNSSSNSQEYGLFDPKIVERYMNWNSVKRVGPGFYNDGNTCYLNSTLQCLMYIPSLVQIILSEKKVLLQSLRKKITTSGNENHQMKTILEIFSFLVEDVWVNSHGKTISPRGMVSNIRRIGKQFKPFRQEDAHEYMRQLLDCMHEEILKGNNLKTADGKKAETTFISRVFGGYLCNTLTCSRCKYMSKTFNHFQDLSLDLSGGVNSIQNAIDLFTKIEHLTNGNEWKCDKCKMKVKASKQMTIHDAPNVLVLHLKRFSFGNMFGKVTKHIAFTPSLQLKTQNEKGHATIPYELTGIIVHHGHSTHSGHYIAYVKASNGVWYEMDDSTVTPVSINRVLQSQAYILFYNKVTPKVVPSVQITKTAVVSETTSTNLSLQSQTKILVKEDLKSVIKGSVSINESKSPKDSISTTQDNDDLESDDDDDFSTESRFLERQLKNKNYGSTKKFDFRFKGIFKHLFVKQKLKKTKKIYSKAALNSITEKNQNSDISENSSSLRIKESSEESSDVEASSDEEDSDDDKEEDEEEEEEEEEPVFGKKRPNTSISQPSKVENSIASHVNIKDYLLQDSRRGRVVGGEGVWDTLPKERIAQVEKMATVQKRSDQEYHKKKRLSLWDQSLDSGKLKKIKNKPDPSLEIKFNPFQRVSDERNHEKKNFH